MYYKQHYSDSTPRSDYTNKRGQFENSLLWAR